MARKITTSTSIVRSRRKVFVDTGGWYAVASENDHHHEVGTLYYLDLLDEGAHLLTSEEEPFTMAEMFEGVRESIWSELDAKKEFKTNSFSRGLQRAHLAKLIELTVRPAGGVPEDARSLARADLTFLKVQIEKVLKKKKLDSYTRAHFDETLARIDAALKAQVELQKL